MNADHRRSLTPVFVAVCVGCSIVGCQRGLMPTPNIYVNSHNDAFDHVPPGLRSSDVPFLYATDRAVHDATGEHVAYGFDRSPSLAYGRGVMRIGTDLAWEELVRQSRLKSRTRSLPLEVTHVAEVGRFLETPFWLTKIDGVVQDDPIQVAEQAELEATFRSWLGDQLEVTPRKEVFVYVHGYNESFESAACTIAQIWHFLGRQGLPVLYSWPAGHGGGLRGYTYDRESGEYTVYHLKQFLKLLASCAAVDKVHMIAHSRGADVAMTALRELLLELQCRGAMARDALKLGTVVVAAADLDAGVAQQRLAAERVTWMPERMVVYATDKDRAIGIARFLFDSEARVGQIDRDNLSVRARRGLDLLDSFEGVVAHVTKDFVAHSYFYKSPAVSSDLILLLRDGRRAGAEHGRPMSRDRGLWEIRDGYPTTWPTPGDS